MPTIVTANQLRAVLGVSSSLYNDAYLDDIIDSCEAILLPMLVTYKSPIAQVKRENGVATFTTQGDHPFSVGQSVVITGVNATFNGTHTITAVGPEFFYNFPSFPNVVAVDVSLLNLEFSVDLAGADVTKFNVIPAGTAALSGASTYVGNAAVESAVLSVCVQIFQNRTAGGGAIEGVDFTVTPFRMSRGLLSSVAGLLGPFMDVETMAQ
jgi:hypothetical protein